jgi:hypothetical protein
MFSVFVTTARKYNFVIFILHNLHFIPIKKIATSNVALKREVLQHYIV